MEKERKNLRFWAKTSENGWHPLMLHMLDVAVVSDAVLAREPESTRNRFAALLGLPWNEAKPWLLFIIACHDLGKACPGFQLKQDLGKQLISEMNLALRPGIDTQINHAYVSQIILTDFLIESGWPEDLSELVADAIGCHHGNRASPSVLNNLKGNKKSLGGNDWEFARSTLIGKLITTLGAKSTPTKSTLTGPEFMLLAGLTSFADWIGSNNEHFPFGQLDDCNELDRWVEQRAILAKFALDKIGWTSRTPLLQNEISFDSVFGFAPRPLQVAVASAVQKADQPCVILVEAPMGEGKTEAAFYAHLELQRRFGHRGLYIALPTKATGNAMFERTLTFLHSFSIERSLDIQLLHGATLLNDTYQQLQLKGINNMEGDGQILAGEWFSHKKRALLSEYGVGTVDQALLTILPVRHNFVRLWGMANRVIVFDEIHAYDAYTGTLLIHLIRWLIALGSSVILLSATLPPAIRRKLASLVGAKYPSTDEFYPRLSIFRQGTMEQISFAADPTRRRCVKLQGVDSSLVSIQKELTYRTVSGGMALALVNTVQRAQDLYREFAEGQHILESGVIVGKRLPDNTEIYLFHARFPADKRQVREDHALRIFGKEGTREGRKILIATQVAEQSLDLDFDCMVTDLAPIDLLLQRAGRLWRHSRTNRPIVFPTLVVAGLCGEEPIQFGKPLWWNSVYREDILIRTWAQLHDLESLTLPDDIDGFVKAVYEDKVSLSDTLEERALAASLAEDGEEFAHKTLAHQAIIGFPDDGSWNDSARFSKADDDDVGLHPSLVAQTRLGEDSIIAVPIFTADNFRQDAEPDFHTAKSLFLRSLSLSRKGVVKKLQKNGVPEGWKKSALLRNCFPLIIDINGKWIEDSMVYLDDELGLVYIAKETM